MVHGYMTTPVSQNSESSAALYDTETFETRRCFFIKLTDSEDSMFGNKIEPFPSEYVQPPRPKLSLGWIILTSKEENLPCGAADLEPFFGKGFRFFEEVALEETFWSKQFEKMKKSN